MNRILRIKKIYLPLGLYWQLVLDVILTHVCVVVLLREGYSKSAAVFMSFDSFLKVLFLIGSAYLISLMPYSRRRLFSVSAKFIIPLIWILLVNLVPNFSLLILSTSLFILFKIILFIDMLLCSDFVFAERRRLSIDLPQMSAVQNILLRSSTAIAPGVALVILEASKFRLVGGIIVLFLSVVFFIFIKKFLYVAEGIPAKEPLKDFSLLGLVNIPVVRWGFLFLILSNISFAGVSFILLKLLTSHSHWFWNEITMLYSSFFIIQMIIVTYGNRAIPINDTSQMAVAMMLCGLSVFLVGYLSPGNGRLICCGMLGLVYSLSLSAMQIVITEKLQEHDYLRYAVWGQIASRCSSLLITMLLGVAISLQVDAQVLLICCGLLGIVSACLLYYLRLDSGSIEKTRYWRLKSRSA